MIGFQPLILAARVTAVGNTIVWQPATDTAAWLAKVFTTLAEQKIADRLLVHFSLKGNFIWARKDPKLHLDGNVFGQPSQPDVTRVGLQLPSGDGRRGGDFEMWFWLVGKATLQAVEPVTPPVGPITPPVGPVTPPIGPIAQPERLDLNTATAEELESLPGIGPEIADAIVAQRPFTNVNELLIVDGIGFATLERLKPLVKV